MSSSIFSGAFVILTLCLSLYLVFEHHSTYKESRGAKISDWSRLNGTRYSIESLIHKHHPLYRYVSDNRCAYMEIFLASICFYGDDCCKGFTRKIEACDEDEDFVMFDGTLGYHNSHETVYLTGPRRSYRGDYF
ncbi:uncharacterized protein LOC110703300 isoform X2 [Chenopodium quinoa]|uniref:uncharacterized protein LOC110703300 isoform X2 n=1 Tax=Chenopodium quinoa TaxID=63459 RepID=UPI000B782780|nr:uncharacterized protein LOC110703300 isoform X2 [Chenopodium quinoa]